MTFAWHWFSPAPSSANADDPFTPRSIIVAGMAGCPLARARRLADVVSLV